MNRNQTRGPLTPAEEFKYAKLAMEWYGWVLPLALASRWRRWRLLPCLCASPSTAFDSTAAR